jgi:hypothetical protein
MPFWRAPGAPQPDGGFAARKPPSKRIIHRENAAFPCLLGSKVEAWSWQAVYNLLAAAEASELVSAPVSRLLLPTGNGAAMHERSL